MDSHTSQSRFPRNGANRDAPDGAASKGPTNTGGEMPVRVVSIRHRGDFYDAYVGRRMFPSVMARIPPEKRFTQFGNPYRGEGLLERYEAHMRAHPDLILAARVALDGKPTLACWCAPAGGVGIDDDTVCHAQILARAVRGDYDEGKP